MAARCVLAYKRYDGRNVPPTEAALLRLLGVKGCLLRQQFSDQFFGPINRDLIAYREQYHSIPLNRLVDYDALITHGSSRICAAGLPHAVYR
jgi:hypothetical protein